MTISLGQFPKNRLLFGILHLSSLCLTHFGVAPQKRVLVEIGRWQDMSNVCDFCLSYRTF